MLLPANCTAETRLGQTERRENGRDTQDDKTARKERLVGPPACGPIGATKSILRAVRAVRPFVSCDLADVADVQTTTSGRVRGATPAVPVVAGL